MRLLRTVAHWLFGRYRLYRIYSLSLDDFAQVKPSPWVMGPIHNVEEVARSNDGGLRGTAADAGKGALGFGAWVEGELASVCWYWFGERYRTRNFWPLKEGEAKLIQVTTAAIFRGRGIAPALIGYSAYQMKRKGFGGLYARVWRSNRASIRAFTKAGWSYVAYVAEVFPFRLKKRIRLVLKTKQMTRQSQKTCTTCGQREGVSQEGALGRLTRRNGRRA